MGWKKEFPNEVGLYWFYGYRYGRISCGHKEKPELSLVKVRKIANGLMYTTDGQFMYKKEVEEAWFKPVDVPELPKDFKP